MSVAPATHRHTRDQPFPATLIENRLLTKAGSEKETRHFVISLARSGLTYKPGDSLGVFPSNDPALVEQVLARLGARGDEPVSVPREPAPLPLREALFHRLSLATPTRATLEAFATHTSDAAEQARIAQLLAPEAKEAMAGYFHAREQIDLLEEFPGVRFAPQDYVALLRRLVPRLYSIASSQRVHPEEVHLTVALVRYETNSRPRSGVCSTFLADRVVPGRTPVPVFVADSHFGLPAANDADIIMVGPGTGVAPFRAFLEEREARGARGRNWLFFGEQRRATDFLYEEEFTRWLGNGVLHRLDTAFSRDQAHKIYVQQRMTEQGAELWRWLEQGAHFYVCGDAHRMARDVDAALHAIVAEHGGLDPAVAADYVKRLKQEKRYQRDVY